MNWKSTALLSGAGVLATWFASSPPRQAAETNVRAPSAQQTTTNQAVTDIVEQAERLRARLQLATSYQEPSRNPFRFGQQVHPAPTVTASPSITDEPAPIPDVPPSPSLRIMLSGIAEDGSGDGVVRTAIISTPQEVFLVKEGEEFGNLYRVAKITANSVELTRLDEGSPVRLEFKP